MSAVFGGCSGPRALALSHPPWTPKSPVRVLQEAQEPKLRAAQPASTEPASSDRAIRPPMTAVAKPNSAKRSSLVNPFTYRA